MDNDFSCALNLILGSNRTNKQVITVDCTGFCYEIKSIRLIEGVGSIPSQSISFCNEYFLLRHYVLINGFMLSPINSPQVSFYWIRSAALTTVINTASVIMMMIIIIVIIIMIVTII